MKARLEFPVAGVKRSYTYEEYRQLTAELVEKKGTTGPIQNENLAHYTQLNHQRMSRLDKKTELYESTLRALEQLEEKITLYVITEAWCGDAAQILPVIGKMANASEQIDLQLILRDEHPEIMDLFLTNGGRAIPKVIVTDAQNKILGSWGPRPKSAVELYWSYKNAPEGFDKAAFSIELQKWYTKDKTREIQQELSELLVMSELPA